MLLSHHQCAWPSRMPSTMLRRISRGRIGSNGQPPGRRRLTLEWPDSTCLPSDEWPTQGHSLLSVLPRRRSCKSIVLCEQLECHLQPPSRRVLQFYAGFLVLGPLDHLLRLLGCTRKGQPSQAQGHLPHWQLLPPPPLLAGT